MFAQECFNRRKPESQSEVIRLAEERFFVLSVSRSIQRARGKGGDGARRSTEEIDESILLVGRGVVTTGGIEKLEEILVFSEDLTDLRDGRRSHLEGLALHRDGDLLMLDRGQKVFRRQDIEMFWDIGHAFLLAWRQEPERSGSLNN